jgi:DNA repair exonuclease SbcCD ATPase subunit
VKVLSELAPLCLCSEVHQHQARALVGRWVEGIGEIKEIGGAGEGFGEERKMIERELQAEREKVEELKRDLGKVEKERAVWMERCAEAEGAKEPLLILVNRRGKELSKNVKEVERLEGCLREVEISAEVEKRAQVKVVEDMREKLEEQGKISRQLVESLEEVRNAREESAQEGKNLKAQLAFEQQVSKQRRQAFDESKKRTADLVAQIENLNNQLSSATQENEKFKTALNEVENSQSTLSTELETAQARAASEQETTAQLRTELSSTQTELATLQITLTQTQQELRTSQQANVGMITVHGAEKTELREKINDLESQLAIPFRKRLKAKVKKLVKRFGDLIGVPGDSRMVGPDVKMGRDTK